ncbi:MAG: DUF6263 family protein [Ferruginibacter sp.]
MRTVFLLLSMALALNSFSQKNNAPVVLTKGQKFTVHTTSTQEADMGIGMDMKNNTSSQNNFYVIDISDKNYTVSSTLTGLKVSMDFMGQQSTYDSDLKEDSASEIGKSIKNLNIPDTVIVNKYTASVSADKKESIVSKDDSANPLETLFESMGDNSTDVAITDAFFIIPAGKKVGDSWTDSSSTKSQKTVRTCTITSVEKNIATINVVGKVESNIQTEVQSLQVNIVMTTKTNSEIILDTRTSLVSKRSTKAAITGNLDLMGQSAPITGKAATVSIYEY